MGRFFHRIKSDVTGAITADYVVLVGAVIVLGFTTMSAISDGAFEGMRAITEHLPAEGCVQTGATGTTDLSNCQ